MRKKSNKDDIGIDKMSNLLSYLNLLQMFPARNPINFIKNQNSVDKQTCAACFKLSVNVYRCAGPCKKLYCIDCVDRFASVRYRCSFCNDDKIFSCDKVTKRSLIFTCPYEPSHAEFQNIQQFNQHCYSCPVMTPKDTIVRDNIVNYQCDQGHRLIFLSSDVAERVFKSRSIFSALTNSRCKSCAEITLCRSYCSQCTQNGKEQILYCVKCRLPPSSKTQCPLGHLLTQRKYRSTNAICDFCGYSDRFSTDLSYNDMFCNFDICHRCYLGLHNENKLIPLSNQFKEPQKVKQQKLPDIHQDDDEIYS